MRFGLSVNVPFHEWRKKTNDGEKNREVKEKCQEKSLAALLKSKETTSNIQKAISKICQRGSHVPLAYFDAYLHFRSKDV
jgi:hypothetical protein